MKCPHCNTDFHHEIIFRPVAEDKEGNWGIGWCKCAEPKCLRVIVFVVDAQYYHQTGTITNLRKSILARPKGYSRPPLSPHVPGKYAEDYNEASLVLNDSPKASAALTRRCLQNILRDVAKVKPSDLFSEIEEVISQGKLPSHVGDSLDAVRNIGNFAAHPIKSKSTGEIVQVESGEAEWNLDTLDALFDFYFVSPAATAARKALLNKKLKDAGKPLLK
jgi:hypothetical protein